ncbi:MAG: SAM-dependent methyltransferase [Deltaproteobacteria bacterium]|jgi:hypothetical protein|nr:SAM-dependent methyltransferase [Deltaproteobacteria bacterium]
MTGQGWNPASLLELTRNFWTLCAIQAGVALDLFTALDEAGGRLPVGRLAERTGADARATGMLATALAGLGLLEREGEVLSLTGDSRRFLSARSGDYYGHMLIHQSHIMPAWAQLATAVRTGRRVAPATAAESGDPGRREAFLMAMHENARRQAEAVAEALDLSGRRTLLDLGGGPGTYAASLCARHPDLSAVVFDLPGTAPVAGKVISGLGLGDRVSFVGGDFCSDPLPGPFGAVLISQVLHQEGPDGAAALVAKAAGALEPGGLMAVQEFFLEDDLSGPASSALFSLNMLVNTGAGQSYSFAQVAGFMEGAGLVGVGRVPASLPQGCAILAGTKA